MADVEFDHEVDVVVVGFGCAGAAAAQAAALAGASVVVLERASGPGGSSAQSGGELYLGGGTAVQQACGFADDADNMFAYLASALGPNADLDKLRLYCDGSVEHFEWFRECGVEFTESLYDAPTWMPPTQDGLMWLGENAWPYTEQARPVPRGHRPSTEGWAGHTVMAALVAAAGSAGVETHVDTRATSLVVDGDEVVGVVARKFGESVSYRARNGVVLTTGGFVDNEDMLADHAPALLGHGKVSDGLDDGSGIALGQSVGGAIRRMASIEVAYTALPAMLVRGMLVNGLGQRFINEDAYPGVFSHAAFHQPGPCWAIVDEAGLESIPEQDLWGVRPQHAAETLAELEIDLGLPIGSLEATVGLYNRHAADGVDGLFHKNPKWVRTLEGPWAAVDPRLGFAPAGRTGQTPGSGFSGFTLGGLRTSVDGEVISLAGAPVPGLFAAGRATSGIHGDGYVSGTSLGDGTFFGRRAGRTVASRTGSC
ncbi:3-oxo-5alpha-steroid 4-dehydrogenase [Nocardioides daedukensis]|uniref:3-oxo-5alpha-steroid 4-dehydrogenase n=1 Tax=Nocardioides daedukensis TaxID=634462 RepID=A0A7Y9S5Q1_9ACTN|nr:3-oxo-5alpha-steroid 4-dehydrogenase [Nocardioides daedukensis]